MRSGTGLTLVAVLLTCLALWGLLGAGLLFAVTYHRVAIATRDHAAAMDLLHTRVAMLRDLPVVAWPDVGEVESGAQGACTWEIGAIERDGATLRVRIRSLAGRTELVRDATIYAP